uniref:Uncharacterized protein n=1 Tax=Glossina palpalis gambiensis TaxID=67801 RepID=A0A1B0BF00_9MUSC
TSCSAASIAAWTIKTHAQIEDNISWQTIASNSIQKTRKVFRKKRDLFEFFTSSDQSTLEYNLTKGNKSNLSKFPGNTKFTTTSNNDKLTYIDARYVVVHATNLEAIDFSSSHLSYPTFITFLFGS